VPRTAVLEQLPERLNIIGVVSDARFFVGACEITGTMLHLPMLKSIAG
jgi:hypothetical protein